MKKRIALQGFLVFSSLLAAIFCSGIYFPVQRQGYLAEFFPAFGIGLILLGFLFRVSARGYKAENSHQGKALVSGGPYLLLRNPMYFGTLLIGSGVITLLFSWWYLPIFLAVFLAIYLPQACKEESLLLARFGASYKNYCKTTSRFFPGLSASFRLDLRRHLFFKLSWLKKEISSLLWLFGAIFGIEIWADFQLFGYLNYQRELKQLFFISLFCLLFSALLYEKDRLTKTA